MRHNVMTEQRKLAGVEPYRASLQETKSPRHVVEDENEELPEEVISRLEAEGIKIRYWEKGGHVRYYLKQNGRDLGYLTPDDDGSTGSCKGITKRRGYIADLVRG